MGKTAYNCFARFYYGYVLNVDKLWFGNGLEIFFELAQTLYSKIKIWSTFEKARPKFFVNFPKLSAKPLFIKEKLNVVLNRAYA